MGNRSGSPGPNDDVIAHALRAGAAIYNAGHYHAAHDAWEHEWLALEAGTPDERLLHGLIQFTAVVHHGTQRNWRGAQGLAESAVDYLSGFDSSRGVEIDAILPFLRAVAADPETLERRHPPALWIDGETPRLAELSLAAAMRAGPIIAAELDGYDPDVLERAIEYAREEVEEGTRTTYIALVRDFVGDADRRPLIYQRLAEQVQRRRRRETDVHGLFDK